jgi:hypothetical protein
MPTGVGSGVGLINQVGYCTEYFYHHTVKMKQYLECIMVEMKAEIRPNSEKFEILQGTFTWVDVH